MKNINTVKTLVNNGIMTHGGIFHADDVFVMALLRILFGLDLAVKRVFKIPEGFEGLAFDIGFGEFDHHQADGECYADGLKKAAFGILSSRLMPEAFGEEVYACLLPFIRDIDEQDNFGSLSRTGESSPMSGLVSSFVPTWDSTLTMDQGFERAVGWAIEVLNNLIARAKAGETVDALTLNLSAELMAVVEKNQQEALASKELAKTLLAAAERKGEVLVLDRFIPWKTEVEAEVKFCVYPAIRGGWDLGAKDTKIKSLPKEWIEEKPEGCTFVHQGLFMSNFTSKEAALAAIGVK